MASTFHINFVVDIRAETLVEKHTPLHLAAHCNPQIVFEEAAVKGHQEPAKKRRRRTVEADGGHSAVVYGRQLSSEETIRYITKKEKVDVSRMQYIVFRHARKAVGQCSAWKEATLPTTV